MSIGAAFWGGVGKGSHDAQMQWEQLFLNRDELKEKQRQFDLNYQATLDQNAATANRSRRDSEVDRMWDAFQSGEIGVEGIYGAIDSLAETYGEDFSPDFYKSMVGHRLTTTPTLAAQTIEKALNGVNIPRPMYEQAVRAMQAREGRTGADAVEDMKYWMGVYDDAQKMLRDGQEVALEYDRSRVTNLNQQTSESAARTAQLEANSALAWQDYGFNETTEPLRFALLSSQATIAGLDAKAHPERLRAELDNVYASTRGLVAAAADQETKTQFFNDTWDLMVSDMEAKLQISQEEARHLIATGIYRDAIMAGDADVAGLAVERIRQEMAESQARIDRMGAQNAVDNQQAQNMVTQNEQLKQQMHIAGINMITDTIMSAPHMWGALKDDLFDILDFDDEARAQAEALLDDVSSDRSAYFDTREYIETTLGLLDVDQRQRTHQSTIDATNVENEYKVRYFREDGIADEERTFAEWATKEGFRVDWERIAVSRDELASRERIANMQAAVTRATSDTNARPSILVQMKAITDATGIDENTFRQLQNVMRDASFDALSPLTRDQIMAYQVDLRNNTSESPLSQLKNALDGQARSAYNDYVNMIASYIRAGSDAGWGIIIPPGVSDQSLPYYDALLQLGYITPDSPGDAPESGSTVGHNLWAAASVVANGADPETGQSVQAWDAAAAVYEQMSPEEREQYGVTGMPIALAEDIAARARQITEAQNLVNPILNERGYAEFTPANREEVANELARELASRVIPAREGIMRLMEDPMVAMGTSGLEVLQQYGYTVQDITATVFGRPMDQMPGGFGDMSIEAALDFIEGRSEYITAFNQGHYTLLNAGR